MKNSVNKICVFCGSNLGNNIKYRLKAKELGKSLVKNKITLVYGGGNIGLMGELAQTVLGNKGYVIGIIPKKIYEMVNHVKLSELHVVSDMHERKAMMYELSDGFIILPGGIGTVEEFFEIFTWYQLGYHLKPIGLLNISNYFLNLDIFLDHMVSEGFLKREHKNMLLVEEEPDYLIEKMKKHEVVYIDKLK